MKDFDARLEEIRRRSEALKKAQQHRRKWAIAVMVSVFITVICAGAFLPGLQTAGEVQNGGTADGISEAPQSPERGFEESHSTVHPVTGIRITGKGTDKTIDDPAVIGKVCTMWDKVTAPTPQFSLGSAPIGGTGEDPGDPDREDNYTGKTSSTDYYIVSFLDAEGIARQYRLNQSVLTELTTGETDFLAGDDLSELYKLLALPIE